GGEPILRTEHVRPVDVVAEVARTRIHVRPAVVAISIRVAVATVVAVSVVVARLDAAWLGPRHGAWREGFGARRLAALDVVVDPRRGRRRRFGARLGLALRRSLASRLGLASRLRFSAPLRIAARLRVALRLRLGARQRFAAAVLALLIGRCERRTDRQRPDESERNSYQGCASHTQRYGKVAAKHL